MSEFRITKYGRLDYERDWESEVEQLRDEVVGIWIACFKKHRPFRLVLNKVKREARIEFYGKPYPSTKLRRVYQRKYADKPLKKKEGGRKEYVFLNEHYQSGKIWRVLAKWLERVQDTEYVVYYSHAGGKISLYMEKFSEEDYNRIEEEETPEPKKKLKLKLKK